MLAYITGTVDQELLLRNEYLATENRILKAQLKGRLLLTEAERATLGRRGQEGRRRSALLPLRCAPTRRSSLDVPRRK